ncbi:ABC transporter permease [Brevibacillus reuszeri]|uniref:ABC transporter permease n=1 Tax=Brevibacillus reuszeri TaxID=54915 RepID=UPI000CCC37BA|nr:ABC transporter permease [Brevibacillus reuszeri]
MIAFLCKKLLRFTTLLIALCVLSFWLVSYSPLDPIQAYVGADMTRVSLEQREAIAEYWGLNKSPVERFLHWGSALVQGDMGTSMIFRLPVAEVIGERFMASLALMSMAWLFSGIMGFVLGALAGMKQGTWVDRLIKWYCFTLASTPTFWLGMLMVIVFAVWLGWFPVGLGVPAGLLAEQVTLADRLYHLVLPALTLSILGVANVALHTRQKLVDILASDYVLFARARGEKGFVLFWRHGLRNVAIPAIMIQFASFSELIGGTVLAEQVFSYPGLGQATVQAGLRSDLPLLLGIVICSALFVFVGNLVADIIYRLVDPRIRKGESV